VGQGKCPASLGWKNSPMGEKSGENLGRGAGEMPCVSGLEKLPNGRKVRGETCGGGLPGQTARGNLRGGGAPWEIQYGVSAFFQNVLPQKFLLGCN
jgi:hypothetical protein